MKRIILFHRCDFTCIRTFFANEGNEVIVIADLIKFLRLQCFYFTTKRAVCLLFCSTKTIRC